MVEVFVTDIHTVALANQVYEQLQSLFPDARITFDLEDCDKILKIEGNHIDAELVIHLAVSLGITCRMLV